MFSNLCHALHAPHGNTSLISPSNFWSHSLKHFNFIPMFFILLFVTLCGPVVSSAGAHGFVIPV